MEQGYLLGDHGQLGAQIGQLVITQGHAVQQYLALAGLVKPGQQLDQRGLAAAGAAHQCHRVAGGNIETDIPQYLIAGAGIGKPDMAQAEFATGPRGDVSAPVDLGILVQLRENVLRGGQAALDFALHLTQLADGLAKLGGGGQEGDQGAGGKAPQDVRPQGKPHQGGQGQGQQALDNRRTQTLDECQFEVLGAVVLAGLAKPLVLLLLAAEDADFLEAADALPRDLGHVPHGGLDTATIAPEMAADEGDHHGDNRGYHREYQAQAPVEVQQVTGQGQHSQPLAHDGFQRLGDGAADLLHIESDLGNQRALGLAIVVGAGCHQHLVEQLAAQLVDKTAGNIVHAVVAQEETGGAGSRHCDHGHRHRHPRELDAVQAAGVEVAVGDSGDDAGVHLVGLVEGIEQELQQVGQQYIARRVNDVADQAQGKHEPQGLYVGQ